MTQGNLLRCLIGENLKTWDLILPMTEVAYNGSVNRITDLSPFEIVNCFKPRQPVDLIFIAHHHFRVSNSASAFASHIRALHEGIREKIMKNNADYKASADLHHRLRTFNVRDYMMVRMRPERFPPGTVKKLHARSAEPFKILKKINSNAYVVDLPPDFGISCTFNVEDLVPYRGTFDTASDLFVDEPSQDLISESSLLPPLSSKLSYATKNIDSILDDQVISTRDGRT